MSEKKRKLSLNVIYDEKNREKEEPWYKEGLAFSCTGCGKCCTGFPGAVWVSNEEIEAIAEKLQLSVDEVYMRYTRQIPGDTRRSLKEVGPSFDCIFLRNKKECQIYDVRPKQCKTYPWWPSLLENPESWNDEKRICEGIDHPEAPIISKEEIQRVLSTEE